MVGGMGVARIVRGAVLVIAAGVAARVAVQRRNSDPGLDPPTPTRTAESAGGAVGMEPPLAEGLADGAVPRIEPMDAMDRPPVDETPIEEPPTEELPPVEEPPVEEPPVDEPPVEEPPVEEPPVRESPVEEPPVRESPVEAGAGELSVRERAPEQQPPSVTDIVDDLLAPYRDRDARIEDATVVEGPSGADPERRARP